MWDVEADIKASQQYGQGQSLGSDMDGAGKSSSSSGSWMVTFTDLVSLMMTFFVMLFSMSTVKLDQWDNVVVALSKTLAPTLEQTSVLVTSPFNITTVYRLRAVNLDYLASVLQKTLSDNQLQTNIVIRRLDDRLKIIVPKNALFALASDKLSDSGKQTLFVMGGVFSNIGNKISVNGYTDPSFISDDVYKTGWQLSLAQSLQVAKTLGDAGYPNRILSMALAAQDNQPELNSEQPSNAVFEIIIDETAGLSKK